MEKDGYREILADILAYTGGKRWLTAKMVAEFTGLDYRTVKRRFGVGHDGIAAAQLAKRMS